MSEPNQNPSTNSSNDLEPLVNAEQESNARSVKWGSLGIAFAKMYFLVAGYALFMGLSRLLSLEQFGKYGIIFGVVSLVNMVLINGTMQAVSRFVANAPPEHAGAIRRFCFQRQIFFAIVVLSIYLACTPLIAYFLKDESLGYYLRLGTAITFLYCFYAINVGYLNGRRWFLRQASLDVTFATMKVGAMVFLVYLAIPSVRLTYAIYGFIAAAFLILIISFFVAGSNFKKVKIELTTKSYLHFAFSVMGIFFILNFFLTSDLLMLKRLLPSSIGDKQAGYYTAAQSIARIPFYLMNTAVLIVFPAVAKLGDIKENKEKASELTTTAILIVMAFLVGIAVCVWPLGTEIVRVLYPEKMALAGQFLPELVLAMCFLSITHLGLSMLSSAGRPTFAMLCFLSLLVVQFLLLMFLIPRYGNYGAALATAIAAGLGATLLLVLLAHFFGTRYPLKPIALILVAAGVAYGIVWASKLYLPPFSKITTVLVLGVSYLTYLSILYFGKVLQMPKRKQA